jgi:hypothetical protein
MRPRPLAGQHLAQLSDEPSPHLCSTKANISRPWLTKDEPQVKSVLILFRSPGGVNPFVPKKGAHSGRAGKTWAKRYEIRRTRPSARC